MRSFCFFSSSITFFILLSGCGDVPQQTREITLVTQFGASSLRQDSFFTQLAQPFSAFSSNLAIQSTTSCKQRRLFAAVKEPNTPDSAIQRYPIKLRMTNAGTFGSILTEAAMLTRLSSFATLEEPIKVTGPTGSAFEIGIIGTLYEPNDLSPTNIDDYCDEEHNGSSAAPSFALVGHVKIPATNSANTIALNTWVVQSAQTGNVYCSNPNSTGDDDNQTCPKRDLLKIVGTGLTASTKVEIESAASGTSPHRVITQTLSGAGGALSSTYVVSIMPIRITYTASGTTQTTYLNSEPPSNSSVNLGPFTISKVP